MCLSSALTAVTVVRVNNEVYIAHNEQLLWHANVTAFIMCVLQQQPAKNPAQCKASCSKNHHYESDCKSKSEDH